MSNPWYTEGFTGVAGGLARASQIETEVDAIASAFDLVYAAIVSGAGISTSRVTASVNPCVTKTRYIVAANSLTFTLPSAPVGGDTIYFLAETSAITGTIIARNGKNIMAVAEDMTVDTPEFAFGLVFDASTNDWRLV